MKVAIVGGTAGLGYGLALRLAKAGDEVIIGSRSAEKGVLASDQVRSAIPEANVQGGENKHVVEDSELVIVAVPFAGQAGIYRSIKDSIAKGTPILDCTVPLASEIGGKATRTIGVWEGSAAQQARSIVGREMPFASGFHTIMAGRLEALDKAVDQDVLVCGDREAKDVAKQATSRIPGSRFVDCGPIENARILESITALLIGINHRYKLDPGAGIRITDLTVQGPS